MPGVPDVEASTRVRARLRELFERHKVVDPLSVDRFYDSERGYYPAAEAGEERDHFGVCLASVGGELYAEGETTVTGEMNAGGFTGAGGTTVDEGAVLFDGQDIRNVKLGQEAD